MNPRDYQLTQLRPEIPSAKVSENMSAEEKFQNGTLRPIVKLQNDLLVAAFRNYITKHKNAFYELGIDKRLMYIENAIQRDIKFRNSLKGMIIGQFTIEEYQSYIENSSALNKRMMNLVRQRLQDNIQLLERDMAY
ncbi:MULTISPECIES: glyoxalase [unclassified Zunongwangia]|uniref:glyoxalase n=1 Tax=unclassified Zunongwangia TaxID=2632541 RepID=UPI0022DE7C36|nr:MULTISPECIES: glyoxalase [unclassified Zunongwangia]WBL23927.1 glyoxalase [Zunongwangia sp. HRR-M8]WBL24070.1 glyoxalase [Zunongwangia sp. HGR-M22]